MQLGVALRLLVELAFQRVVDSVEGQPQVQVCWSAPCGQLERVLAGAVAPLTGFEHEVKRAARRGDVHVQLREVAISLHPSRVRRGFVEVVVVLSAHAAQQTEVAATGAFFVPDRRGVCSAQLEPKDVTAARVELGEVAAERRRGNVHIQRPSAGALVVFGVLEPAPAQGGNGANHDVASFVRAHVGDTNVERGLLVLFDGARAADMPVELRVAQGACEVGITLDDQHHVSVPPGVATGRWLDALVACVIANHDVGPVHGFERVDQAEADLGVPGERKAGHRAGRSRRSAGLRRVRVRCARRSGQLVRRAKQRVSHGIVAQRGVLAPHQRGDPRHLGGCRAGSAERARPALAGVIASEVGGVGSSQIFARGD